MRAPQGGSDRPTLGVVALVFNAMVWGISWWPLREVQAHGLHPLWSTVLIYLLATLGVLAYRPQAWRGLLEHPGLLLLLLASGLTNVSFNWAVTVGDVVRVVLLFYLMPAWSVLIAWLLLNEKPSTGSLLRLALACGGDALMLFAAVQAQGQQQGHREGARIVEQGIGLQLVWQGASQGIKEG